RDTANGSKKGIVKELLFVRAQLANLTHEEHSPQQQSGHRERFQRLEEREQELSRQLAQTDGSHGQAETWTEIEKVRHAIPGDAVLIDIAKFRLRDFQGKRSAAQHNGP